MRLILALLLAGGPFSMAAADKPQKLAIANAAPVQESKSPYRFTQEITIEFKSKALASTDLSDRTKWNLVISRSDGSRTLLHGSDSKCWSVVTTDSNGLPATDSNGHPLVKQEVTAPPVSLNQQTVVLTLPAGTLSKDVASVLLAYDAAQFLWTPSPPQTTSNQLFSSAPDKSHSDIYLSGLYSPALNSPAQYTIDAQARVVKQLGLSHFRLGGIATVSTDKRQTADPDSFLVSGLLEWIPIDRRFLAERAQGVLVDFDYAGLEFDRKTTTKTFITSSVTEIPFRLYPAPKAASRFALGLTSYLGLEAGTNLSNALNSNGSGTVFRGLLGSSLSFVTKTQLTYLSQIVVSCSYTARVPAKDEIFTLTKMINGKSVDMPTLSTQVRHHLIDELDLTIAKPFSITIKHEYGELPPVFRRVDQKVSIGFTVMFQQNNGARAAIASQK